MCVRLSFAPNIAEIAIASSVLDLPMVAWPAECVLQATGVSFSLCAVFLLLQLDSLTKREEGAVNKNATYASCPHLVSLAPGSALGSAPYLCILLFPIVSFYAAALEVTLSEEVLFIATVKGERGGWVVASIDVYP